MATSLDPKENARKQLRTRIDLAESIKSRPIRSYHELNLAEAEFEKWEAYNVELLRNIFTSTGIPNEYLAALPATKRDKSFPDKVDTLRSTLQAKIYILSSIAERIDLITGNSAMFDPTTIFLAHGHDEVRETVARHIEKLGLKTIILDEQPNHGQTIIEKFEKYAKVSFAVILLTPDDVGGPHASSEMKARARQNVIFELGYFYGTLGRSRVCALYKGEIELPSDFHGILYIQLDPQGAWRLRLYKELMAAGMNVDSKGLL